MYKFLFILLLSFSITQEPCEGTCFSEEEVLNITNNIKELQFDVEKYKEIEVNLNSQICLLYTSPSPRDLSTSRMPSSA